MVLIYDTNLVERVARAYFADVSRRIIAAREFMRFDRCTHQHTHARRRSLVVVVGDGVVAAAVAVRYISSHANARALVLAVRVTHSQHSAHAREHKI